MDRLVAKEPVMFLDQLDFPVLSEALEIYEKNIGAILLEDMTIVLNEAEARQAVYEAHRAVDQARAAVEKAKSNPEGLGEVILTWLHRLNAVWLVLGTVSGIGKAVAGANAIAGMIGGAGATAGGPAVAVLVVIVLVASTLGYLIRMLVIWAINHFTGDVNRLKEIRAQIAKTIDDMENAKALRDLNSKQRDELERTLEQSKDALEKIDKRIANLTHGFGKF